MTDGEPDYLLPPLLAGATGLHENLVAFIEAGFTRPEALQIVMMMLREAIRSSEARSGGVDCE